MSNRAFLSEGNATSARPSSWRSRDERRGTDIGEEREASSLKEMEQLEEIVASCTRLFASLPELRINDSQTALNCMHAVSGEVSYTFKTDEACCNSILMYKYIHRTGFRHWKSPFSLASSSRQHVTPCVTPCVTPSSCQRKALCQTIVGRSI